MTFKELMKVMPSVESVEVRFIKNSKVTFSEDFRYFISNKYDRKKVSEVKVVAEGKIQVFIEDEGKDIMVMYYDVKTHKQISKIMGIDRACKEFGVTEKQIQKAIREGCTLKTMTFDEV